MGEQCFGRRRTALLALALMLGAALVAVSPLTAAERNSYTVTPLVSDQAGVAPNTDGDLVNGWGLTSGPTTPWWVSDNGTNKSTLYSGTGTKAALTVDVPGGPTGTVFNGDATAFAGGRFLFANEAGQI